MRERRELVSVVRNRLTYILNQTVNAGKIIFFKELNSCVKVDFSFGTNKSLMPASEIYTWMSGVAFLFVP